METSAGTNVARSLQLFSFPKLYASGNQVREEFGVKQKAVIKIIFFCKWIFTIVKTFRAGLA
jgi:hypothetical protein